MQRQQALAGAAVQQQPLEQHGAMMAASVAILLSPPRFGEAPKEVSAPMQQQQKPEAALQSAASSSGQHNSSAPDPLGLWMPGPPGANNQEL